MDDNVLLGGMAAVPVITALLQVVKPVLPVRLLPLAAVALGVGWNVGLTVGTDEFSRATIFVGVLVGLAASGLYSAGRSLLVGSAGAAGAAGVEDGDAARPGG